MSKFGRPRHKIPKAQIVISIFAAGCFQTFPSFFLLLSKNLLRSLKLVDRAAMTTVFIPAKTGVFLYLSLLSFHSFLSIFCLVLGSQPLYLCVCTWVWGPVREPWEAWEWAWRAFRFDAGADHSGNNCSHLHSGRGRGRHEAPLRERTRRPIEWNTISTVCLNPSGVIHTPHIPPVLIMRWQISRLRPSVQCFISWDRSVCLRPQNNKYTRHCVSN